MPSLLFLLFRPVAIDVRNVWYFQIFIFFYIWMQLFLFVPLQTLEQTSLCFYAFVPFFLWKVEKLVEVYSLWIFSFPFYQYFLNCIAITNNSSLTFFLLLYLCYVLFINRTDSQLSWRGGIGIWGKLYVVDP